MNNEQLSIDVLKQFSAEDLALELKRRESEKNKKLLSERISRNEMLIPLILKIVEHDRTSCSDDHTVNDHPNSEGFARCSRCVMLTALANNEYDEFDINFYTTITFRKLR